MILAWSVNCERCGRLFWTSGSAICIECREVDDDVL